MVHSGQLCTPMDSLMVVSFLKLEVLCMDSLQSELLSFAKDEGVHAAIRKGEQWRDVLEEIAELRGLSALQARDVLLDVHEALNVLMHQHRDGVLR